LCGELETVKHLIFLCPLSHINWLFIKEALGWLRPPKDFGDFIDVALKPPGAGSNRNGWAVLGVLAWSIWNTRNVLVFNNKICPSLLTNISKTISFLSQWKALFP
jgi:hypothetical protein